MSDINKKINEIEIKNLEYNNKKILSLILNDKFWFKGKDVCKTMGYGNPNNAVTRHVNIDERTTLSLLIDKKNINFEFNGNELRTIFISINGLIQLLVYSMLPNKEEFIKWCNDQFSINCKIITRLYKEQETVGQLINAFKHLNYKTQYVVGSYRIDLYFIDKRIAVECDEFNHKYRNIDCEKTRVDYIKDKLNCTFIRYNPDDVNFTIFNVINDIIQIL